MTVISINENREVTFESAEIIWRNFAGEERQFNDPGDRNFCIVLDEQAAQALANIGYNVKRTEPQDPERDPVTYLKVTVSFKGRPPQITTITNEGKTRTMLGEGVVELIDGMDIETIDLIINPYDWNVGSKSGVSAYLKKAFIVPLEDALDRKWAVQDGV